MELIEKRVTSETEKYSSAVGESKIQKICLCCRYSETDKNPIRFRKKIKFCAHHTFSVKESQLCGSWAQFLPFMVNCRDIWSVFDTD
jgi:hypothetical protein